jgi:hypothetical protein
MLYPAELWVHRLKTLVFCGFRYDYRTLVSTPKPLHYVVR